MCEPASIIALTTAVIGAVVSASAAANQGKAAANAANYRAKVAENNRIIASAEANDAFARGRVEEENARIRSSQLQGRQRAGFASQGVLVDQDTAAVSTLDTQILGEADALTVRDNAAREAAAITARGEGFAQEGVLARSEASNIELATRGRVAGTLLSGAGKVAGKWYDFNSAGAI